MVWWLSSGWLGICFGFVPQALDLGCWFCMLVWIWVLRFVLIGCCIGLPLLVGR